MNKSYLMNKHSRAEYLGSSQEAQEKRNKGYVWNQNKKFVKTKDEITPSTEKEYVYLN